MRALAGDSSRPAIVPIAASLKSPMIGGLTWVSPKPCLGVRTTVTDTATDDTVVVTVDVAADALVGTRDVVVINPDGGRGTIVKGLTVNAGPKPTSMSPAALKQGATSEITITGTNFDAAPLPAIAGVEFADVAVDDDGNITATATVSATAARGVRNLTVTNTGDSGFGTCVGCFAISSVPMPPTGVTVTQGDGSAVVS